MEVFVGQVEFDAGEAVVVGVRCPSHQFEIAVEGEVDGVAVLQEVGGVGRAADGFVVCVCTEPARIARGVHGEETVQFGHEIGVDHANLIYGISV